MTLKAGDEPVGSWAPTFWFTYVLSVLPEVTWISAPVGADGDQLGEVDGVPDGAGDDVPLDEVVGAAVAWMNGSRLWNWSSVGFCLAGSAALARPLPVVEAKVDVSARPAADGFSAP